MGNGNGEYFGIFLGKLKYLTSYLYPFRTKRGGLKRMSQTWIKDGSDDGPPPPRLPPVHCGGCATPMTCYLLSNDSRITTFFSNLDSDNGIAVIVRSYNSSCRPVQNTD